MGDVNLQKEDEEVTGYFMKKVQMNESKVGSLWIPPQSFIEKISDIACEEFGDDAQCERDVPRILSCALEEFLRNNLEAMSRRTSRSWFANKKTSTKYWQLVGGLYPRSHSTEGSNEPGSNQSGSDNGSDFQNNETSNFQIEEERGSGDRLDRRHTINQTDAIRALQQHIHFKTATWISAFSQ
eukprot:m.22363 g.22363  ORF g.22363 m.22363 type:complete len:183 (+) comp8830_c0_seq1:967-1515(+)